MTTHIDRAHVTGRLDPKAEQRFVAAIRSGAPVEATCRRFKIGHDTGRNILRAHGVVPAGAPKRFRKTA